MMQSLDEDIQKTSPTLGREAVYQQSARVSRLPSYLTVHMVRFYWRRDISKKTKIMRKVKFPFDLDVLDIVTDDLKAKLRPVNERFKDIDKDRRERAKVRRRAKVITDPQAPVPAPVPTPETIASGNPSDDPPEEMAVDTPAAADVPDAVRKAGELVNEPTKRREEVEALNALIDADLKKDHGANVTGLYELAGIVTHKGASADGDKYQGEQ